VVSLIAIVQTSRKGKGLRNMAKSSASLNVLYGEANQQTLAAQAASMQKAGHRVQTAVGRSGVQQALREGSFDLVILGPTLSRDDRHHLPYMVKKSYPNARVLVLHADGGRHPYVDAHLDTGHQIEELLAKIAALQDEAFAARA
jgi:hypothetical protein